MGVTSKDHPGLFKKNGGNGAADNVVWSEHPVLRDNLQEGANGYADPNDLLEAIRREVAGDPLRTIEDMNLQVRTMSADVEIARKFGSVDMAEQLRKIDDEADAKIARAKTDKERTQIEKGRKAAKRDVEASAIGCVVSMLCLAILTELCCGLVR